jgi:hypothetical protein
VRVDINISFVFTFLSAKECIWTYIKISTDCIGIAIFQQVMSNTNGYTIAHIKWKEETKGLLQRKGLWNIIATQMANAVTVDAQKALGYMHKNLDTSGREVIRGIDTPFEAWVALENNFNLTYAAGLELYESELQRYQWDGSDLELNYKQFLKLRGLYIGCGGSQSPITYGNYFLRGMNIGEIESTKQALMGTGKTLEQIMARCRIVVAQMKIGSVNEAAAYGARLSLPKK